MQDKFTQKTLDQNPNGKTQEKLNQANSQTSTSSLQDSLAKLLVMRENGSDFKTQEARYFMKLLGLRNKKDLTTYSLKMLEDYYSTRKEKPSHKSSVRLMNWGTIVNGKLSTANISFHKAGIEYSLSDILEDQVEEKYFLSDKMVKSMVAHDQRHKSQGNGLQSDIVQLSLQATTKDGEQEEQ